MPWRRCRAGGSVVPTFSPTPFPSPNHVRCRDVSYLACKAVARRLTPYVSSHSRPSASKPVEASTVKLNKFSASFTESETNGGAKAMLYATGMTDEQMGMPQIGISGVAWDGACGLAESVALAAAETIVRRQPVQQPPVGSVPEGQRGLHPGGHDGHGARHRWRLRR